MIQPFICGVKCLIKAQIKQKSVVNGRHNQQLFTKPTFVKFRVKYLFVLPSEVTKQHVGPHTNNIYIIILIRRPVHHTSSVAYDLYTLDETITR